MCARRGVVACALLPTRNTYLCKCGCLVVSLPPEAHIHPCTGRVAGTIRVNGQAIRPKQLRAMSGYVVQEDILPGMLTVLEHLELHALLRMGAAVSVDDKLARAKGETVEDGGGCQSHGYGKGRIGKYLIV